VSLNLRRCAVLELLKDCTRLVDVLAQEKGQRLTCDISGKATIEADALLLRRPSSISFIMQFGLHQAVVPSK
jgi:hypothetical protein